jgi:hypothetical protein
MRTRLRGGYSGLMAGLGVLFQLLIKPKGCLRGGLVFENKTVKGEAGGIGATPSGLKFLDYVGTKIIGKISLLPSRLSRIVVIWATPTSGPPN